MRILSPVLALPLAAVVWAAPPLSQSEARRLLAEWEGEAPPVAVVEETEDPPLTLGVALRMVWEGVRERRRLGAVVGISESLWQEAAERGWIDGTRQPSEVLGPDEFQDLYLASRDPANHWHPHSRAGFRFTTNHRLLFSLGPPWGQGMLLAGTHAFGASASDRWAPVFTLNVGLIYQASDAVSFFAFQLEDLSFEARFANPAAWYRLLSLRIGRFEQEAAFAYRQRLDGLRGILEWADFRFFVQTGFAGLLHKGIGQPLITPSDFTDFQNPANSWGPPRALSAVGGRWYAADSWQVDLTVVALTDLRERVSPGRVLQPGDTLYTSYEGGVYQGYQLTLGGRWAPSANLELSASGAAQAGSTLHYFVTQNQYVTVGFWGYALDAQTVWRPAVSSDLKLWGRAFVSSGDGSYRSSFQEGSLWNGDRPVSFQFRSWGWEPPLRLLRLEWGNLWGVSLGATQSLSPWIPLAGLGFEALLGVVGRVTDGPVSDLRVQVGGAANRLLGIELFTQTVWEPWAEFGLILALGGALVFQEGAFGDDVGPFLGHLSLQARLEL